MLMATSFSVSVCCFFLSSVSLGHLVMACDFRSPLYLIFGT